MSTFGGAAAPIAWLGWETVPGPATISLALRRAAARTKVVDDARRTLAEEQDPALRGFWEYCIEIAKDRLEIQRGRIEERKLSPVLWRDVLSK